ncbi:hypothetical protein EYF80_029184 [Liparis tanakae]|uniref:Uncharacterized protein n=1 Tax=Liparis tanakae TaxID=230148 RepID=A0A4Z2H6G3_9TELE|nr:hypothetical protein EYF80_029184 [Liparis tanakae]
MAYITADKHYAPTPRLFDSDAKAPPSPDAEAAADSSSLGLEEISSCSGGRNAVLTPHLEQGFQLLCQLSNQNVSRLSDQSFQPMKPMSYNVMGKHHSLKTRKWQLVRGPVGGPGVKTTLILVPLIMLTFSRKTNSPSPPWTVLIGMFMFLRVWTRETSGLAGLLTSP